MAADGPDLTLTPPEPPEVFAYVEDMAMDLAAMASRAGETALAASLALVGLQAGAARRQHAGELGARHQASRQELGAAGEI